MWHRHGQSIDFIYVVGEPERFFGTEEVANLLAEHAGLVRVSSPDDRVCWTSATSKGPIDSVIVRHLDDDLSKLPLVITYAEGTVESRSATLAYASELAITNGLSLIPTGDSSIRWTRDPHDYAPARVIGAVKIVDLEAHDGVLGGGGQFGSLPGAEVDRAIGKVVVHREDGGKRPHTHSHPPDDPRTQEPETLLLPEDLEPAFVPSVSWFSHGCPLQSRRPLCALRQTQDGPSLETGSHP
jgi:hypothetical protein